MWNYSVLSVIVKWQHLNMDKENRKILGKLPIIIFYQLNALFESTSEQKNWSSVRNSHMVSQRSNFGRILGKIDTFCGSKQKWNS